MSFQPLDPSFYIYFLSEKALTIEFGKVIDENTFKRITAFNLLLQANPFTGFKTSVAAYTTLTIYYDPLIVAYSSLKGINCFDKVGNYLIELNRDVIETVPVKPYRITIPMCYGGKFGPDLSLIAEQNHLNITEVIKLHSAAIYKVHMIGFVPGFAYMGGMDEKLATPRKSVPRAAIPAGSVGIAGNQTGIYPLVTPGGWQILGQTPLQLFNIDRLQPALLKAGDEVVFKAIDNQEFEYLART